MTAKAKEWLARKPKALDKEQARLLMDVLDHPDDMQARLVYADWLMERSDPRGELISLSIQAESEKQAKNNNKAQREKMLLRAGEIAEANRNKWLEEMGWPEQSLGSPHFVRGFIHDVDVLAQVWVKIADAILTREPVRVVRLRGVKPASLLDEFLANPHIKRLREIDFWGQNSFSAAQVKKIASAPNLENLEGLSLFATALGGKGLKVFFESFALPKLARLHLGENKLDAAALQILTTQTKLPSYLNLSSNYFAAEGMKSLAACPGLETVSSLALASTRIGDEGAKTLASSKYVGNLKSLRVLSCDIGPAGAEAIAKGMPHLEMLDISSNPIENRGAKALCALTKLKRLSVEDCEIDAKNLKALMQGKEEAPRYSRWSFYGTRLGQNEGDPTGF